MNQDIFCQKLKQKLPPLDFAPLPGKLGQRVLKKISKQAWQDWLNKQVMLINENHLSLSDEKTQAFLTKAMEDYLFNDIEPTIAGFKPPSDDGFVQS